MPLAPRLPACVRVVLLALFAAAVFFASGRTIAQEGTFTVRDIRVEGLQRISEGTVFNYLPVNIGDRLDPARIRDATSRLWHRFFRDVEIRWDNGVVVAVAEGLDRQLHDHRQQGRKTGLNRSQDRPEAGQDLQPFRSMRSSSPIDQYFSRGKYAFKVTAEVEDHPTTRWISPSTSRRAIARIRQINLVSNRRSPTKPLPRTSSCGRPAVVHPPDDRYSREDLSGDLETLESYYMDAASPISRSSRPNSRYPRQAGHLHHINIVEGERYKISDVRLGGELVLPAEQLNSFVKPGQTYSQRLITQSADLIRLRLGERALATVNSARPRP